MGLICKKYKSYGWARLTKWVVSGNGEVLYIACAVVCSMYFTCSADRWYVWQWEKPNTASLGCGYIPELMLQGQNNVLTTCIMSDVVWQKFIQYNSTKNITAVCGTTFLSTKQKPINSCCSPCSLFHLLIFWQLLLKVSLSDRVVMEGNSGSTSKLVIGSLGQMLLCEQLQV